MEFPCALSPSEWLLLRQWASAGRFSFKVTLVDKIKGTPGRRWTEDRAIEVHRVTKGEIACWSMRPDIWAVGQLPPCLANLAA